MGREGALCLELSCCRFREDKRKRYIVSANMLYCTELHARSKVIDQR